MDWKRELPRQIFHFVNGTLIALASLKWGSKVGWMLILLSLTGLCLSWQYTKKSWPLMRPLLEFLDRPDDIQRFPGRGAILYGMAVGLTLLLYPLKAAVGAVAILAAGDSLSTLAGKAWGKRKWPWNRRLSLEGSLAFFLGAFLYSWLFIPAQLALAGSLAGTLAETVPGHIDDNVTIPLVTGGIIALLLY
jgi:dolichol kinase